MGSIEAYQILSVAMPADCRCEKGLKLWLKMCLTNLASRWEGVRLPRASGKSPDFPGNSPNFPRKFFGDFPGSSLTVELNSNPEVPRKFPRLPRKFPKLPRKFPDFPGGQPLSLGSLTPSPDSQKLSLLKTCLKLCVLYFGCDFFAHSQKLPAYSGAFLLTVENFSFFTYSWSFFAYSWSFFCLQWESASNRGLKGL